MIKEKKGKTACFVVVLLIIFSMSVIIRGDVGIDWEYTFDTADSLNNWNVAYGNWTVDEGSLVVNDYGDFVSQYEGYVNSIWHEQTSLSGNWSFDVLQSEYEEFGVLIYFIGNGVTANIPNFHPAEGYVLHLWHNDKIDVDYVTGGSYQYSISEYTPSSPLTGWIHFEITRDRNNEIAVYLNDSEIISVESDLISTSENINIQAEKGVRFDNFKFTENSQQSTPAWTNLINILCIVAIIVVRKRRKNIGKNSNWTDLNE